jgi:chromosome segregation ATPase
MADNTDLLNQFRQIVREENEPLKERLDRQDKKLDEQGKDIKSLKTDVSALKDGQETLELKGEVINANQQRAEEQSQKDHAEIMERLVGMVEIEGKEHKLLERRVERIEKHSNLPPPK